jgi:glycine oxidase
MMVDARAYVSALSTACARAGAKVLLGEEALEVRESDAEVAVRTRTGNYVADQAVVAMGSWSGSVPGLSALPVRPMRGQMLRIFHPDATLGRIVSGPSYMAPWRQGEIVVGATEEDAGFAPFVTPAGLFHLSAVVARLSPLLRDARFVESWAGLRSATPSGRPIIGRHPGTRRVVVGTGHGGQGIVTGGLTGRLLVELLRQGKSDLAEPFAPERHAA